MTFWSRACTKNIMDKATNRQILKKSKWQKLYWRNLFSISAFSKKIKVKMGHSRNIWFGI